MFQRLLLSIIERVSPAEPASARDCQNPGHMDSSKSTIHGTGCPFPDWHDGLID